MKKIITAFCFLFILSCEKDDSIHYEQNHDTGLNARVQIKQGNDVSKSAINYIRLRTNNYFTVESRKNSVAFSKTSFSSKSSELGIVDTSKEIVVINETNTKHTFKVISPFEENSITNLIIVEKENSTYEYFLKYNFIGEIPINEETKAVDLSRFTGTIETFNSEGDLIGGITVENGVVINNDGQHAPCPDEPTDDPNDEPVDNNNSTGGSDAGTGIPGTGDEPGSMYDNTDSSSGGELVDVNGDCGLSWSYAQCGCGGKANGHPPQDGVSCCQGSPLIITDCNGSVIAQRNANTTTMFKRTSLDPCDDGDVGVIIDADDCNTSKEDLKKVFPNASDDNLELLAKVINDKGKDFGIDSDEKLWHFLAQAGHEVGGEFANGIGTTESLFYTTDSRLKIVFAKYFQQNATDTINKRKADSLYLRNSSRLGNYVYADRMGNGNEASGDGYKYRGRGIFQLTGKNNYEAFKTFYNNEYDPDIDPVTTPSLIKTNDTLAVISALWFYKTNVLDKITIDSLTTVKKITKKVNGGKKGLSHRKLLFKKAKDSITCK